MSPGFNYLAGLLCLGVAGSLVPYAGTGQTAGLNVLLGRSCPDGQIGDGPQFVVRVLPGERFRLNEKPLSEVDLRQAVIKNMQPRLEKLVWIAADQQVSYGDVIAILSKLQKDVPDLHLAIATRTQTGPVDPVEVRRSGGKHANGVPFGVFLCVSP